MSRPDETRIVLELRLPRWGARPARHVVRLGLALALIASLALPFGVLAQTTFTDVPPQSTSFPFHDAIYAIYNARITQGCNFPDNTLYCPGNPVNRDQMAAFLQRGLGRVTYGDSAGFVTLPNTFATVDLAVVQIKPGELQGGTVFVKLDASATAQITQTVGCPCEIGLQLVRDNNRGQVFPTYYTTISGVTTNTFPVPNPPGPPFYGSGSLAATWALSVTSGVTETFRLQAFINAFSGAAPPPVSAEGALTAAYYPFGAIGTNTLTPTGAPPRGAPATPANQPDVRQPSRNPR